MKKHLLNLISLNEIDKDKAAVYTEDANEQKKHFATRIKLNLIWEEKT